MQNKSNFGKPSIGTPKPDDDHKTDTREELKSDADEKADDAREQAAERREDRKHENFDPE